MAEPNIPFIILYNPELLWHIVFHILPLTIILDLQSAVLNLLNRKWVGKSQ